MAAMKACGRASTPILLPMFLVIASSLWNPAAAFATLHVFCTQENCADGNSPWGELMPDQNGALYGTAWGGGTYDKGVIFELAPNAPGKNWSLQVLYNFCSLADCADGQGPLGGLIRDQRGDLYGLTSGDAAGGPVYAGTAFELVAIAHGAGWKLKVLHTFCQSGVCADGVSPRGTLTYVGAGGGAPYDGTSPLYGVTLAGGKHDSGVAFALMPDAGTKRWKEKVIYNFCSLGGEACTDGRQPQWGLTAGTFGNLYGTTAQGGAASGGTAFELAPNGDKTKWAETVLHNFCEGANCKDGEFPVSGLLMDASSALYGTTRQGGAKGYGVLFKLVPEGTNSTYSVLHEFCAGRCNDGAYPSGRLAMDSAGNIFGTAEYGGKGEGTVYEYSGSGLRVIHKFAYNGYCTEGCNPYTGVTIDGAGHLYGSTIWGPELAPGTVFMLRR